MNIASLQEVKAPELLLDGLWQMTLQEATVHTNKIRLHGIELKQTLEGVIYRWDAACKIVLLDSITMLYSNVRWIGWPSEAVTVDGADVYLLDHMAFGGRGGFRNGSPPKIDGEPLTWIIDSLWYRLCHLNSVATPCALQHTTAEWQLDMYVSPCSSLSRGRLLLVLVTLGYSRVFFVSRSACWPHKGSWITSDGSAFQRSSIFMCP